MDFSLSASETAFAEEVRTWLEEHLVGEFASLRGRGGMGQEDIPIEQLLAWEREMASGGWIGLGYPEALGGRSVTLMEQVLFFSTYVEAEAPGRYPNVGATLLGPTVVAYGREDQQQRFVPPILASTELWCQGYSEPNAGSDLANVATKAELDGDEWVINGQKVWTSLATEADWCFVVARTEAGSERHKGLSYLLVPMDQPGIEIRPIVQITGGSEFNEVFFSDARTAAANVVGEPGEGWKVAMGTLGFERGASTLGQQMTFRHEFEATLALAQERGIDPVLRQELAQAYITLEILRFNQLRMLSVEASGGVPGAEMSIGKLYWASWHRAFGELMMKVRGASGMVAGPDGHGEYGDLQLDSEQRSFLYSRAHTIYGGSNQVQRNILGERVLGLPREPR